MRRITEVCYLIWDKSLYSDKLTYKTKQYNFKNLFFVDLKNSFIYFLILNSKVFPFKRDQAVIRRAEAQKLFQFGFVIFGLVYEKEVLVKN